MSTIEIESVPRNYAPQTLRTSIVIPGRILVYGFTVYSSNAAGQYGLMFDADALPANGSAPIVAFPLQAHNGFAIGWQPQGRAFDAGLVLANSSTDSTLTVGSADCLFDVQYD